MGSGGLKSTAGPGPPGRSAAGGPTETALWPDAAVPDRRPRSHAEAVSG